MKFNENLKILRKEAGLTQEELAEKLNVSRQAVTKWESGQAMPDIINLKEIAYLFSVTTDSLLEDIECRGTTKLKKKINDIVWYSIGFALLDIFAVIIPICGFIGQLTKDDGLASIAAIVIALISMIVLGVFIKRNLTNNTNKILDMSETEKGKVERRKYIVKKAIRDFVVVSCLLGISKILFIPQGAEAFFRELLQTLGFSAILVGIEAIMTMRKLSKKVKELNQ